MKAAVFLERDGILTITDRQSPHPVVPLRLEQFKVNEAVRPLLQSMKDAGLLLLVATHQPAVSRGELSRNELDLMHRILAHKLPVDDILLCASDDPSHPCYKPQPGLFLEAAFKWSLDLDRCFIISDKWQDAKAAQVAGCTSVLVKSPWVGTDHHDFLVNDLESAVKKVLQLHAVPFSYAASA
jgi:D-glycero-D-manno-heptose 1,7-bisphosphate phosphatase